MQIKKIMSNNNSKTSCNVKDNDNVTILFEQVNIGKSEVSIEKYHRGAIINDVERTSELAKRINAHLLFLLLKIIKRCIKKILVQIFYQNCTKHFDENNNINKQQKNDNDLIQYVNIGVDIVNDAVKDVTTERVSHRFIRYKTNVYKISDYHEKPAGGPRYGM